MRKNSAYGVCWTPSVAPMAKTTAWAASNVMATGPGASSSTTASTTVVRPAETWGPRGSMPAWVAGGSTAVGPSVCWVMAVS